MSPEESDKNIFLENPHRSIWNGRTSLTREYWHENIQIIKNLNFNFEEEVLKFGILGYAVDEGVKKNFGRIGAQNGPLEIKKTMGGMAYHLNSQAQIYDYGNIICPDGQLEQTQSFLQKTVCQLMLTNHFPILIGGGHDLAFGHLMGIQDYLNQKSLSKKIGIINLDAHFDLRPLNEGKSHSGSPFFQWSEHCENNNLHFNYLCLGIQRAANPQSLFETAEQIRVEWIEVEDFHLNNLKVVHKKINEFLDKVDHIYLTIDLDGFSSAFAPGVSAASPMGFSPDIALTIIKQIIDSKKLISTDIVEYNPLFDLDGRTAKLAGRLIEFLARKISN